MKSLRLPLAFLLLSLITPPAIAQDVVRSRGVDARVDYAALTEIGPWDDRNYQLGAEDLLVLADNERELKAPLPVFYRVLARKSSPALPRSGPAQYPRSAVNFYLHQFGGYLVDGQLHRGVRWDAVAGRYQVASDDGVPAELWQPGEVAPEAVAVGEHRVSAAIDAAESAIAFHPSNSSLVIAGSNGPTAGQTMHASSDGGATWTQVTLPLGSTCCDPSVEWNTAGTLAYAATLGSCSFSGCSVWVYRTGDNGASWTDLEDVTPGDPRREVTSAGQSDKEYLHVDRFPTSAHNDNVYLTWHDGNVLKFSRSTDDGNTWSAPVSLSSGSAQLGIGSDIATDKDGNVYYFWPSFGAGPTPSRILVRKSGDGGSSFASVVSVADTLDDFDFAVPVMETRRVFIYVGADADLTDGPYANRVYVTWTDNNGPETSTANNHARIQVAFSTDGGATWNVRTPHETADITTVDRFHPWLAVDGNGIVHVIFYDTRRDASRNSVDLFHSASTDGGDTWSTPDRLTSVQSPNITDGFEWGDYNGLSAVMQDVIAIYTDNRNELGGGGNSVDVYAIGLTAATPLFADGFESGDTAAWALTVP